MEMCFFAAGPESLGQAWTCFCKSPVKNDDFWKLQYMQGSKGKIIIFAYGHSHQMKLYAHDVKEVVGIKKQCCKCSDWSFCQWPFSL